MSLSVSIRWCIRNVRSSEKTNSCLHTAHKDWHTQASSHKAAGQRRQENIQNIEKWMWEACVYSVERENVGGKINGSTTPTHWGEHAWESETKLSFLFPSSLLLPRPPCRQSDSITSDAECMRHRQDRVRHVTRYEHREKGEKKAKRSYLNRFAANGLPSHFTL